MQRFQARFFLGWGPGYDGRMTATPPLAISTVRNGRGLVARKEFRDGSKICILKGRSRTAAKVLQMWASDARRAANCIRCGSEAYLDPAGQWGEFANHSCRPNAAIRAERGRLVLRALRAIRAGDEVTHDYSTCLGADDAWTMRCNCGERGCRGRIGRFDRLPAPVLRRYLRLNAIPAFILRTVEGD